MNFGSICVLIVLIIIVALIIRGMIKDHKAGKSAMCGDCECGGGCDGKSCPSTSIALEMAKNMEERFGDKTEEKDGEK